MIRAAPSEFSKSNQLILFASGRPQLIEDEKRKKASVRQPVATEFGQNRKWSDTDRRETLAKTCAVVSVKAGKNRNKIARESRFDSKVLELFGAVDRQRFLADGKVVSKLAS